MPLHLTAPLFERHPPWQYVFAGVEDAFAASYSAADLHASVLVTDEALGPLHFLVEEVSSGVFLPRPIVGIVASYEAEYVNGAGTAIPIPSAGEVVISSTSLPGLAEALRVPREEVIWDPNLVTGVLTLRQAGSIRFGLSIRHMVSANAEFYVTLQKWNGATWDDVSEVLSEDYRQTSGSLTRSDFLSLNVLVDDQIRFVVRHRDLVQRTWTFFRFALIANYVRAG